MAQAPPSLNHSITQAQGGDAAAFERLLEDHYEVMHRFAYQWCGNASDAEDVVQLACIKLARSLPQFRFESAFQSWLYRLVINCAKDWARSQNRHRGECVEDIPEPEAPGAQSGEVQVFLQQILQRLESMADGFKETVLLVHGQGLSHAEAAMILQVKESTISWRLHEVRNRLALLLGGAP